MQLCTAGTLDHSYATGDSLYRASSKVATLFKPFTRNNSIPEISFRAHISFLLPPALLRSTLRCATRGDARRREWRIEGGVGHLLAKERKKEKKGGEITL